MRFTMKKFFFEKTFLVTARTSCVLNNTENTHLNFYMNIVENKHQNAYKILEIAKITEEYHLKTSFRSIVGRPEYANRVSYEVLVQHSPRLSRALPEKEECLKEAYWDR